MENESYGNVVILGIKRSVTARYEDVLRLVEDDRTIRNSIKSRKQKWIGHSIMFRDVIEGKLPAKKIKRWMLDYVV